MICGLIVKSRPLNLEMSLDSMRGSYGRSPPLLVAGLLVVCVLLTFNWWTLSTQNYDLIKQIADLGEQLKISSEEQDLCVHQRLSVEGRVKVLEEELAQVRVNLEQQRTDNDEMKKQLEAKDDKLREMKKEQDNTQKSASSCKTELESLKKVEISKDGIIASLRLEKEQFAAQLEGQKQELQQLRNELEQVQGAFKEASKNKKPGQTNQKMSTAAHLRAGELREMTKLHVTVPGLNGIVRHKGLPILPQDPPDAVRPPPRFSVTKL